MELLLLNDSFQAIKVLDQYESLIWTERYSEYGDFEIYEPASESLLNTIKGGKYLYLEDSEQVMVIEDIKIETDAESVNHLIVSGRSLESILDRRIVWKKTRIRGNFQNGIKRLLEENLISPSIADRKVDNIRFVYSEDSYIQNLKVSKQFTGDNLYDAIKELCDAFQIGFKITLSMDKYDHLIDESQLSITDSDGIQILSNVPPILTFTLYRGKDRSYDPYDDNVYSHLVDESALDILDSDGATIITAVPKSGSELTPQGSTDNSFVVFSAKLDNVKTSEYVESTKTLKNVTLVAGEDESYVRRNRIVGRAKGLDRRELYTDARDIQSELDDGTEMSVEDYYSLLDQRGVEKLLENQETKSFSYEVDPYLTYTFKRDYDKGDLVQVINEYGIGAKCRITEVVRSHDENGFYIYPTFGEYSERISSSYSDGYSDETGSGEETDVGYVTNNTSNVKGIPSGGKKGQVLTKNSASDYDVSWKNQKSTSETATNISNNINPYTSTPEMDGTGSAGSSYNYARGDHVHPTDTSRAPVASPAFTGTAKVAGLKLGSESAITSWNGFTRQTSTTTWVEPTSSGASLVTPNGGGYYVEGKHVYVSIDCKLTADASPGDNITLFTGLPTSPMILPIEVMIANVRNGVVWINTSGELHLRPSANVSSSNNVRINGHYTSA